MDRTNQNHPPRLGLLDVLDGLATTRGALWNAARHLGATAAHHGAMPTRRSMEASAAASIMHARLLDVLAG